MSRMERLSSNVYPGWSQNVATQSHSHVRVERRGSQQGAGEGGAVPAKGHRLLCFNMSRPFVTRERRTESEH